MFFELHVDEVAPGTARPNALAVLVTINAVPLASAPTNNSRRPKLRNPSAQHERPGSPGCAGDVAASCPYQNQPAALDVSESIDSNTETCHEPDTVAAIFRRNMTTLVAEAEARRCRPRRRPPTPPTVTG